MTHIVGQLNGLDGPLKGRLFLKPSAPFIGAPANGMSFKIEDGIVDIEVPANANGTVWLVDWKDSFDLSPVTYIERWKVPVADVVTLDDVRIGGGRKLRKTTSTDKTDLLELTLLRQEAEELRGRVGALENEKARLLLRVSDAESNAASSAGKLASLKAEMARMSKQALATRQAPRAQRIETERIIERTITPEEWREQLAAERQQAEILRAENSALKEQLDSSISLTTHFANLHTEIDRLKIENQNLHTRIAELKQPHRSASSLRREAIANLDQLISG
jgi:predicted nuclease with TOPRIM domain